MNIQRNENNANEVHISVAANAIEQMKYEIARELESHLDLIHHRVQMVLSVEKLQNA